MAQQTSSASRHVPNQLKYLYFFQNFEIKNSPPPLNHNLENYLEPSLELWYSRRFYQLEQKIGKVNKWILFLRGKTENLPFLQPFRMVSRASPPPVAKPAATSTSYLARIRSWTRQSHPTKPPHKEKKLLLPKGLEFPDRDAHPVHAVNTGQEVIAIALSRKLKRHGEQDFRMA